jgi:SNF2 family DNA or RNA helicase
MIKLEHSANPEFCKVISDNYLVNKWLPKSPSRVYFRLEKIWAYPITEIADIFEYANKIQESVELDPIVEKAYIDFTTKVEIVKKLKNNEIKSFNITKPNLFKNELEEKYKYQYSVISQMLLMHKCLLVVPVGLGKTVMSLYTILKLKELVDAKVLIVCESNQIHKPWIDTILKFTDLKDFLIIEGNAEERARRIQYGKADMNKYWLWIASYDTVKIEFKNLPKNWTVLLFDEITKIKNISTDVFKGVSELDAPYKYGLSATPIVTNYYDLYGIMKTINPNIFTSKQNFSDRYLQLDIFNNPRGLKPGAEEEIKRKIFPWTVYIAKKDVMEVKPKEMITFPVPLTQLQQKELDRIKQEIESGERTAFESGTILRQICNTLAIVSEVRPVLDLEGNPIFDSHGKPKTKSYLLYPNISIEDSTNKIEKLKEIIHQVVDLQKKKVVVFSFFKTAVELLAKILSPTYTVKVVTGDSARGCKYPMIAKCNECPKYRYCKMIKKEIFEFVEGDVNILLGTDSLSRAHNLYTCDTIVNFDLPWSSADLEQRIGRIDRSNNTAPKLYIYNLVTLGTIEERIIKIIETKERESDKVFPKYNVSLSRLSKTIKVE